MIDLELLPDSWTAGGGDDLWRAPECCPDRFECGLRELRIHIIEEADGFLTRMLEQAAVSHGEEYSQGSALACRSDTFQIGVAEAKDPIVAMGTDQGLSAAALLVRCFCQGLLDG